MIEASLACHPSRPADFLRQMQVRVSWESQGRLRLRYVLEGDMARVRVPAQGRGRRAERLWEHTCFEVFARDDGESYAEYNFSPSSDWAAYRFNAYRSGVSDLSCDPPPVVQVVMGAYRIELEAIIGLNRSTGPLTLAVSSVIEDSDGQLSYWALAHPPGKPDFHHQDGFVLSMKGSAE